MRQITATLCLLLFVASAAGQDTKYAPQFEQIPGPDCGANSWPSPQRMCTPAELTDWLKDVKRWRSERLFRIGYDGSEYDRPELKWTQSSFIQPQVMMEERYLYDPVAGRYTVDRFLDDLEKRYGGVDSVLLWHTYPNIGIDDRNQYDLVRDLPGGIEGVRGMVSDFHRRGVRVLFPIMLWDQGTRDVGEPPWNATAKLLAEIGADGINGDTMEGVPRAYRVASDKVGHPLVLEPESGPSDEAVAWNNMTWGYWKYDFIPMISRYKWLERRHMVNVCDRWQRDKTDNLQLAFFNGVGFESWENVWGIWNQITPRDAEALRRVARMERTYSELLTSSDWEPFTPVLQFGVYASKWPGKDATLWTIINRNKYAVEGRQIELPYEDGMKYFDLWHGSELLPARNGDKVVFSFSMEASGFGAILATRTIDEKTRRLLADMHEFSIVPLQSLSHEWKPLKQKMVQVASTAVPKIAPPGMVKIPAGDYDFRTTGLPIEGGNEEGVDVQYPWERVPVRYHQRHMQMKVFYIDKYPVTNADFKKFIDATKYHPRDDHNFLKHWTNDNYPPGAANQPVAWISIEDAQAYAAWAGKRLPHEWEWQFAAQGTDGRTYPWGNHWKDDAVPPENKGRTITLPSDVAAHPAGASPFGVMDLVGNVWQWTDQYVDEHTRAAILKGGSSYKPQGSIWYFPQAYRVTEHGKYLLIAPSRDRSGMIGFRCVVDAE